MAVPARVYLLGGSSSVGKTTAAAVVAQRLGATHLQLDHIAQASPDPRVRRFQAGVDALWSLPATHLCDLLVDKGEALAEPLHALIRQCLSGSSITVVEGEGVHPHLAPHHPVEQVRFAFVVEPAQAALFQTLTKRSTRFRALPEAHRHTVAATNWRYGNWLHQQAERFDQPWLESRPWATLPDRLLQAWHQPTPEPPAATITT
jgi:2-phosphoglycerate kinase